MILLEEKKKTLSIVIVLFLTIAYFIAFFSRGLEYALLKPGTYAVPVLLTFLWWLVFGLNHWVRAMVGLNVCLWIKGAMYLTAWWVLRELEFFAILGVLILTLLWIDRYDEQRARAAANSAAEPKCE